MSMEIIRGTTPTLNFVLPFETSLISDLKLTFMQNGNVILTKGIEDITLENIDTETDNGSVIDNNSGDEIDSNDAEQEETTITYSNCSVHLTQADTLAFEFWPAAEKNIAYSQIRILDSNGEAYASDPLNFRVYGVLLDGEIGVEETEEEE